MKGGKFMQSFRYALVALGASFCVGCGGGEASDEDAVTVGLLLPFTGDDAATSSNFERAVLIARDRINEAGGIKGRKLRIVSADTHSDVSRAEESARSLVDAGAIVVLGPESAEIAADIRPIFDEHDVILLSPLVGAANDQTVACDKPWFRLAPSARALGEALAKLVVSEGLHASALLASNDAYDAALAEAFKSRFVSLGGDVAFEASLLSTAQTFAATSKGALAADVDSILLSTSPRTGAVVADEIAVLADVRPRLFLSPLLKTDVLLENVPGTVLEGALGVAPRIYDSSDEFPNVFADRWNGDLPLEGAYFYYDALALVSFALERTTLANGAFDAAAVGAAILESAGPRGEPGRWNEMSTSLARIREHNDVFYTGLTGPLLLRPCGDRQVGASSNWRIHDGRIEDVASE